MRPSGARAYGRRSRSSCLFAPSLRHRDRSLHFAKKVDWRLFPFLPEEGCAMCVRWWEKAPGLNRMGTPFSEGRILLPPLMGEGGMEVSDYGSHGARTLRPGRR